MSKRNKVEPPIPSHSLRIAIVHYGEHVPQDEGYRALRYGRLATNLVKSGAQVTRICPSFCFAHQTQRPVSWSGNVTDEGTIILIPTRSHTNSRSLDRFLSIYDLCKGVAKVVEQLESFDLVIVGVPPPGLLSAVRSAVGPNTIVIADIRDLWPDTLAPTTGRFGAILSIFRGFGLLLAKELRKSDGVVAVSQTMLERAPRNKRLEVIPIGFSDVSPDEAPVANERLESDVVFVFVGSFAPLFDFKALFFGWERFRAQHPNAEMARLVLYGDGQRRAEVEALATGSSGVELRGWIASDEVGKCLALADIGIVPPRRAQGITLGNKAMEYLQSGLFVLNSLESSTAAELSSQELGWHVDEPERWADGFSYCWENIDLIRADRQRRLSTARSVYGQRCIFKQWTTLISRKV